ncbi:uncharacterized protein LOC118221649 isoform X2 [Anguilla anguilla]|uniref:uncharacterized protein LOC118221649 isoform X2 n=1 Tax=Anguilla anguilla TaxID=7936 RepID=UPI0015AE1F72|nr:uncharacterized protein LOC118221649 isoform X2 [Anguilla anguilla]
MTSPAVDLAHIIPPQALSRLAREWLAEDTPNFDPAGVCVGSKEVRATLLCKSPGSVLAGCPFFTEVFSELGCTVDWIYREGQTLDPGFLAPLGLGLDLGLAPPRSWSWSWSRSRSRHPSALVLVSVLPPLGRGLDYNTTIRNPADNRRTPHSCRTGLCSGSTPRSPTSWMCPENLQGKAPKRYPDQMPEPGTSGLPCLACCHHDPGPDKQKKMDGWMDGWMDGCHVVSANSSKTDVTDWVSISCCYGPSQEGAVSY